MTYLIAFSYYGSHLHGAPSGSVDRNRNVFGHRTLEPDAARTFRERGLMGQAPYLLDRYSRYAALEAIREVCRHRRWQLLAAQGRKRWSRHGSTRWLFDRDNVAAAIRYVVEEQGEPMAVYVAERY